MQETHLPPDSLVTADLICDKDGLSSGFSRQHISIKSNIFGVQASLGTTGRNSGLAPILTAVTISKDSRAVL